MTSDIVIQYIISGLIYGSIYAVIALGFNIVYNATGIINFAQGEFVMLGGMITHSFSKIMSLPLALLAAVLITAVIGGFIELVLIRNIGRLAKKKLKKAPEMQMTIMTIGISILLRETALTIWGEQVQTVPFFTGNETSSITVAGASFSP
ncbi:MAG TPA: hypothetical protein PLV89_06105, partial [Treponemataceae bacterium]|nr:hypothetical protein [Treponemataceae bacterium]